jgi:hypothetical protein
MGRSAYLKTLKPKPEIQTIANAQDKERWKEDPIAEAKRRSGAESEGGIAKMVVHPLAERQEMSSKANRLPKVIRYYMVYIHTFSGAPEPDLFSRPNVRRIPRKKSI